MTSAQLDKMRAGRERVERERMARDDQQAYDWLAAMQLESDAHHRLVRVREIDGDRPDEVALANTEWIAALRLMSEIGMPTDAAMRRVRHEVPLEIEVKS